MFFNLIVPNSYAIVFNKTDIIYIIHIYKTISCITHESMYSEYYNSLSNSVIIDIIYIDTYYEQLDNDVVIYPTEKNIKHV